MANTFLTSSLIAKEAIAQLQVYNTAINCAYRGNYGIMFNDNSMYAPGDTVNIRLENYYTVQRGNSITSQDILEDSIPLQIQPLYSIGINYQPTDLQRDIVDFSEEFIQPAVRALIAQMNYTIYQGALTQVNYMVGSDSESINSFSQIANLRSYMQNLGMRMDGSYFVCNPDQTSDLISSSTIQNSYLQTLNREVTMEGELARLAGFTMYSDQSITEFTAGSHAASGNITVTTTVSSGNSLTLSGFTASQTGVVNAGDIFTIAGVQNFNSVLQIPNGQTMSFVATSTANSNSSGQATFTISPSLVASTSRQNFYTSTGTIPSGSIVTFQGDHLPNFGYTSRGLVACFPPLQAMDSPFSSTQTDPKYGISVRVSRSAEVMQNTNIMRLDCQMAFAWIANQSVRFVSALV